MIIFKHIPYRFHFVTWIGLVLACQATNFGQSPGASAYYLYADVYDVVYAPKAERLYASLYKEGSTRSNTVAVINPYTGTIEARIPVGSSPQRLAISDDEQYLYVEFPNLKIKRINLRTGTSDLEFTLSDGRSACGIAMWLTDMKVRPGHPETLIISFSCGNFTPAHHGIAAYVNGVALPNQATNGDAFGVLRVVFGATDDTMWGYNQEADSFELYQFTLNAMGVTVKGRGVRGLTFAFGMQTAFANGLLYTGNGRAIDVSNQRIDGRYYTTQVVFASSFALDPERDLAYFSYGNSPMVIQAFDLRNYQLMATFSMPLTGTPVEAHAATESGTMFAGKWGLARREAYFGRIEFYPTEAFKPVAPYIKPIAQPLDHQLVRRFAIPNNQITYSTHHQKIFITTPSWMGAAGNSLIWLNPFTGETSEPLGVGSDPWQMTLSDQEQYLYVALYNGFSVRRINLTSMKPDRQLPLSLVNFMGQPSNFRALEMLPVPGRPESVIVALGSAPGNSSGQGAAGVVVYDDGIRRPKSTADPSIGPYPTAGADSIQLSASGQFIYALNWYFYGSDALGKWPLNGEGVSFVLTKGFQDVFGLTLKCQNDVCFTESGIVVDPQTQEITGRFELPAGPDFYAVKAVVPDLYRNRVYFVWEKSFGVEVASYDVQTLKQVGWMRIPNIKGTINSAVLWGSDQLAFGDGVEVFLIPLKLVEPGIPTPARALSQPNRTKARRGESGRTIGR